MLFNSIPASNLKKFTDVAPVVNIQFTFAISISNVTFGNAIGLSFGWFHFAM